MNLWYSLLTLKIRRCGELCWVHDFELKPRNRSELTTEPPRPLATDGSYVVNGNTPMPKAPQPSYPEVNPGFYPPQQPHPPQQSHQLGFQNFKKKWNKLTLNAHAGVWSLWIPKVVKSILLEIKKLISNFSQIAKDSLEILQIIMLSNIKIFMVKSNLIKSFCRANLKSKI